MKRSLLMILLVACLSIVVSCKKDYVRQEPGRIYRMDGIQLFTDPSDNLEPGCIGIQPQYSYDEAFELESRQFYKSLDTTLVFKGYLKIRNKNMYMKYWNLLDMRIASIEVTALAAFDEKHPAGSSLNDVLDISYWYKRARLTKPVSEISYGSIMLADFIWGAENVFLGFPGLTLSRRIPDSRLLPPVEVRLTDSFGREFTAATQETE